MVDQVEVEVIQGGCTPAAGSGNTPPSSPSQGNPGGTIGLETPGGAVKVVVEVELVLLVEMLQDSSGRWSWQGRKWNSKFNYRKSSNLCRWIKYDLSF
jgi:hypothetical protein